MEQELCVFHVCEFPWECKGKQKKLEKMEGLTRTQKEQFVLCGHQDCFDGM
jgi:hypothetical protein